MKPPANWVWTDDVGYLPLGDAPVPYDEHYFENYARYRGTPMGKAITKYRADWVQEVMPDGCGVLDVGIGSGDFLAELRKRGMAAWGTDVNPVAIEWMKARGYLHAGQTVKALTLWDVLEHIPDPAPLFNQHRPASVFVSTPIYRDEAHALSSKHFKPGEHCWYFTVRGLTLFMQRLGYTLARYRADEITLGRDSIGAFHFTA